MKVSTFTVKPKYLTLVLAAVLATSATAVARQVRISHDDTDANQQVQVGDVLTSEQPVVTINGQNVDLNGGGQVQVQAPAPNLGVTVSGSSASTFGPGGTSVVGHPDGSVTITVSSNSSNSNSNSFVSTGGGTFSFTHSDNSVSVFQNGEGSISVSN